MQHYVHSDWFQYLVLTSAHVDMALPALCLGCRDAIDSMLLSNPERSKKKQKKRRGKCLTEMCRVSQTEAYLYLFALRYMNYSCTCQLVGGVNTEDRAALFVFSSLFTK